MFTMIRRLLLAFGVGTLLVLTGANTAFAATRPPADTKLVYQTGSNANMLALSSNLSAAEQKQISTYIIRVQIMNQPQRVLTVNKLPAMLYNIIPGTRVHAYLTLKGDFGTSKEFDSGAYTQGEPTSEVTMPPTTQSPTTSSSPSPSSTRSATTPSSTASPSPSTETSSPVATAQPTQVPGESVSQQHDLGSFLDAHLLPIGIIAGITFVLLGVLVLLRRRN